MTDIILIYPKTGFDIKGVSIELPLSVLSAASLVEREGYKIRIIDQRIDDTWQKTLVEELKKNPLCVGISLMTGSQIHYGLEASKIVKENSNSKIVFGGIHPSILPIQTIKNEYVDIVVKGEGEETFLELVKSLEKGKDLRDVRGITFKKNSEIINNPERSFLNLDKLPELPYHLVNVRDYIKQGNVFSFISSRGCPFNCAFCCNPLYNKGKWRYESPERTIERIKFAFDKYKFKKFKFNDENFLVNPERAERIAEFINNRFEWEVQARIDDVKRVDFAKLRKTGLYQIQPGIESGSDRILKLIKKGITVNDIIKYNKILSKTGIIATYNFMMGFPTETKEDIYATVDLALRLIKDNPYSEISAFYTYVPYPGTKLFDVGLRYGFKIPQKLEEWGDYSRHHTNTPWIQDKKGMIKNLALTSKFVDSKRVSRLFEKKNLPKFIPNLLGVLFRKRWKKHKFKNTLDLKLIDLVLRKKVEMFT